MALDATTDRCALVFKVPSGVTTISTVAFSVGTVTGASGNAVLDVRLETVDATTGDPSGTLWATNTNGTATVNFNDDNKTFIVTLTASASVTPGQDIAIVINPTSFTTVSSVVIGATGSGDFTMYSTYSVTNNGGAGYAKNNTNIMCAGIGNGSTYYPIVGAPPVGLVTTTTFNSGSSPSKRALKFQLPFPVRVVGCYIEMDFDNDLEIKLYSSNGSTELATTGTLDSSMDTVTSPSIYYFYFTSTANLSANTNYYLSVEPGASSISVYHWSVTTPAANDLLDASLGGKNFILSTNSGSWSDDDVSQPLMGILVDAFDDGSGPINIHNSQIIAPFKAIGY